MLTSDHLLYVLNTQRHDTCVTSINILVLIRAIVRCCPLERVTTGHSMTLGNVLVSVVFVCHLLCVLKHTLWQPPPGAEHN